MIPPYTYIYESRREPESFESGGTFVTSVTFLNGNLTKGTIMNGLELLNNPIMASVLGVSSNPLLEPMTEVFEAKAADTRAHVMKSITELRRAGATDDDIEYVKYGRRGKRN